MPSIKVANDMDLLQHEVQNMVLQNLPSPPDSAKVGMLVFITTDGTVRYWDGSAWSSLADASDVTAGLAGKVDKVSGKGLSTEDYTTTEKTKLAGIAAGAEANVQADWSATEGDAQILNKPTLGTAAALDAGTASGNVPVLNSSGKLPDSVIPPLAIGEIAGTVDTKAQLTTLTSAQQGDIAKVTSDTTANNNGVYWLNGSPTTLSNWVQIVGPGSVISVNGQSGIVVLTAADVSAVPTTRTVNGKALSTDVTLAAADVGAVPTTRTVNGKALSANITLAAADVSAVPTTRTVNGKALSADIELTSDDVGAVAAVEGITGATYPMITYGDDGLVRSGRALTASDIPNLSAAKITSGTMAVARLPTGNATDTIPLLGGASENGQVLTWDADAGKYVGKTPTTGTVNIFEGAITGDGTTAEFSLAHGLGKRGLVQVSDSSGAVVLVYTECTTTAVTVTFGTAPTASESYCVVVVG